MIATIKKDYPVKVSHKKGTIIAKPGDKVKIIAPHDNVTIVELKNGTRISIETKYLQL